MVFKFEENNTRELLKNLILFYSQSDQDVIKEKIRNDLRLFGLTIHDILTNEKWINIDDKIKFAIK